MVRKDSCRCFSVGFAPVFWQSAANIDLNKGINRDTPFALCVICEAFCLLQKSFYVFVLSLPIRGVWIEISNGVYMDSVVFVAPHTGSVD